MNNYKKRKNDYEANDEGRGGGGDLSFLFGSPIEVKDEKTTTTTRTSNRYLPIHKQEVTDERGRKRFHGAFTGGFSAGYFNTVGSKEGFTPSTFKSSRDERTTHRQYSAQDFMDDEDISNMAKELTTKQDYDLTSEGRPTSAIDSISDGIFKSVFKDIVEPTKDPIGLRLLKKMGWKEGQTRVITKVYKKKVPKPKQRHTMIIDNDDAGQFMHDDEQDDEEEEQLVQVEYGKEYPKIVDYTPKNDHYGVGFTPSDEVRQMRMNAAGGPTADTTGSRILFGSEHSIDDTDVYDSGSKDIYDSHLGGRRRPASSSSSSGNNEILEFLKPDDGSARLRRCSDGSLPLKNFVVASHTTLDIKWYEPPKVPTNFDIRHKYDKPLDRSITHKPLHMVNITPTQRSIMLNERVLPSAPPKPTKNLDMYQSSSSPPAGPTSPAPALAKQSDALKSLQQAFASRFESEGDGKSRLKAAEPVVPFKKKQRPTRVVQDWYPAPLLCKRMGVENPYKGMTVEPKKEVDWLTKLNIQIDFPTDPPTATQEEEDNNASSPPYEPEHPSISDATNLNPFVEFSFTEAKRPSLDLFKAIFESNDVTEEQTDDDQSNYDPFSSLSKTTDEPLPPLQPFSSIANTNNTNNNNNNSHNMILTPIQTTPVQQQQHQNIVEDEDESDPFSAFVNQTVKEAFTQRKMQPFIPAGQTTPSINTPAQSIPIPLPTPPPTLPHLPPPPPPTPQPSTEPTYYKVIEVKPYQPITSIVGPTPPSTPLEKNKKDERDVKSNSKTKDKDRTKKKDSDKWVENIKSYLSQYSDESDSSDSDSSDSDDEEKRRRRKEKKKRKKEKKREKKERKKEKRREREKKEASSGDKRSASKA
ncbi:hypothetical protein SAMD00019534_123700 [Acytostelium subglobosum LB1]|uniref:hypothetical protein n=1 Tax=Acytostelium subglobosum LB1 TaxID=1410327 RepID=UPI000644F15F|nr:hypothetical protein SAMD00019534_123700 [Acytostelium subglobosum LB1]GAM29194.1 hypothetical protein SAMD00019534_123700 [Acytostelium subglobosum LB1]|eukprot:XP_012747885.1 hypothetical protein SAMD00019534_123700 [Acytostelium subglobosum LB1]